MERARRGSAAIGAARAEMCPAQPRQCARTFSFRCTPLAKSDVYNHQTCIAHGSTTIPHKTGPYRAKFLQFYKSGLPTCALPRGTSISPTCLPTWSRAILGQFHLWLLLSHAAPRPRFLVVFNPSLLFLFNKWKLIFLSFFFLRKKKKNF